MWELEDGLKHEFQVGGENLSVGQMDGMFVFLRHIFNIFLACLVPTLFLNGIRATIVGPFRAWKPTILMP